MKERREIIGNGLNGLMGTVVKLFPDGWGNQWVTLKLDDGRTINIQSRITRIIAQVTIEGAA